MDKTEYTEQDVRNAYLAQDVKGAVDQKHTTETAVLTEMAEDAQDLDDLELRYQAGLKVLQNARVVMSSRSTVAHDEYDRQQMGDVCSPVLRLQFDYIATSPAYRYVALKSR